VSPILGHRPSAHREAGFTVVEVTIAALLLILGAVAIFQVFDTASRNTYRAEQSQVANDIAQQELERLRALTYAQAAMTAYPAYSSDPRNPNNRVTGTDYKLNPDGSNPASMVVNGSALDSGGQVSGGVVNPGPTSFVNGDVSGKIYRYVVWRDDPTCSNSVCPFTQDFKRIVVAVTIDDVAVSTARSYVEVQSDFIDPNDKLLTETNVPPGGTVTADQFYLSDTACEADGSTTRVEPTADHLLHNTRGKCADGLRTGSTPGAPDALLLTVPPDPFLEDPALPDTFDFADDSYLEPTPDFDDGLQMLRQDSNGCNYDPGGDTPEAKVHRWVSDPIAGSYHMSGHATLEISSKTINGAIQTGKVCVYLFVRTTNGDGTVSDTQIVDSGTGQAFWTYQPPGNWAAGTWQLYRIGLDFPSTTITSSQRLGLAISVERAGSPGHLQFIYDHTRFDSRLEVETTTPLPG
jgi:type II secretory pathway pseudopilin PulG